MAEATLGENTPTVRERNRATQPGQRFAGDNGGEGGGGTVAARRWMHEEDDKGHLRQKLKPRFALQQFAFGLWSKRNRNRNQAEVVSHFDTGSTLTEVVYAAAHTVSEENQRLLCLGFLVDRSRTPFRHRFCKGPRRYHLGQSDLQRAAARAGEWQRASVQTRPVPKRATTSVVKATGRTEAYKPLLPQAQEGPRHISLSYFPKIFPQMLKQNLVPSFSLPHSRSRLPSLSLPLLALSPRSPSLPSLSLRRSRSEDYFSKISSTQRLKVTKPEAENEIPSPSSLFTKTLPSGATTTSSCNGCEHGFHLAYECVASGGKSKR
ncbi:hypothetical protein LR48_Vigan08g099900 [Vigna angularis]|uniref:Uncharacterized protein n=1 Tax=Phaseolus angularis TaxID=3914 RepID=A0A0L9V5F2_PHAAN|nr:hypothetical protein LR48_Vigan08g099900 [Vigna angularis]